MLHTPGTHHCVPMPTIQHLPGNKHNKFRSMWKGVFPLLQDYYHVPNMAVHEVDPEGATNYRPTSGTLHWTYDVACCLREGDNIRPGFRKGGSLSGPIVAHCAGTNNGFPGTPLLGLHQTWRRGTAVRTFTSVVVPLPSS